MTHSTRRPEEASWSKAGVLWGRLARASKRWPLKSKNRISGSGSSYSTRSLAIAVVLIAGFVTAGCEHGTTIEEDLWLAAAVVVTAPIWAPICYAAGCWESHGSHIQAISENELQELKRHAEEGDAEAQYELSVTYGVAEDADKAWYWKCVSALNNHAAAQEALGNIYRYGQWAGWSVERDHVKAYMWYSLAEGNNSPYASEIRAAAAEQLTPAQITEAERLVAEWELNPAECEALGGATALSEN